MQLWLNFNVTMDFAIRDHVLSTSYTHTALLRIAFNQLKCKVALKKRIRLMRLSHLLKAWKDSQASRRQMMAQNVSLSHMRRHLKFRLMSACFHAIR